LADEIGDEALLCELHHRDEHSIEAAIIWLHYLLGDKPCDLLPILCGSFHSFIEQSQSPGKAVNIESAIEVLKRVSNHYRTVIVAAADLAHTGPVFGDSFALDIAGRSRMAEQDEELMAVINRGNADDFFTMISAERDCRHVCGVPPIYVALSVLDGIEGTTLGYSQCPASDDGTSLVSVCGTIF
jgi:AmmeMemoRadiSam system protein B